jgi:DNA recombination protein RmuC
MQEFYILLGAVVLGFLIIIYFLNNKLSSITSNKNDETLRQWLKTMQASIDSSSSNMVNTLQENSKQLNDRLDKAAIAIREVTRGVGEMSEIGRNMRELQEFLRSPKLRGNIGEEVLKDLISQIFPKNSFHLQYQFKNGERVDAAIKTDGGILPIDSKFPMENFQKMTKAKENKDRNIFKKEFVRDVKKHIDAISRKYILPDEGTMDFALMYIPSEAVFYEVAGITELMDYARRQRVYIVSPTTLYAHLQMILLSFEGKKIETRSREVFAMLRGLQTDYGKVYEALGTLGRHITNASSQYINVTSSFEKIGKKLGGTKNLEEKLVEDVDQNAVSDLKN